MALVGFTDRYVLRELSKCQPAQGRWQDFPWELSIPTAIARALKARDGGCRFPGCDRTRFTEGHHVKHWADGGETKLSNLVTLCGFHHRLVHEGGYGLTADR